MSTVALYSAYMRKKTTLLENSLEIIVDWAHLDNPKSISNHQRVPATYQYIADETGLDPLNLDFGSKAFMEFSKRELGEADVLGERELAKLFEQSNLKIGNSLPVERLREAVTHFSQLKISPIS